MNHKQQQLIRLAVATIMLIVTTTIHAQIGPKGKFETKRNTVKGGYNFWLYTPDEYRTDHHALPVIIFLHGASLCGHDLNKVRRYGVLDAIDRGKIIPMFVLAPQNPGGAWNPRKLNDMLEWMEQHYKIDRNRIYVLGMSLGGYGTLDFVGTYPDKIAAAMALCGGCSLKDMSGLGRVPLWIMHGTADRAVNISQSKRVVSFLKKGGNDKLLRYDWLSGGTHGTPARLFHMQKTYDWLLAHSLGDRPRTVDRSFDITWDDIRSTYTDLKNTTRSFDND